MLLAIIAVVTSSCKKEEKKDDDKQQNPDPITATDIDGNLYNSVKIGDQTWLVENLKVTRYNNGDTIPYLPNNVQWKNTTEGARSFYDDNTLNIDSFGMLYNFRALEDSRKICPTGWHVSTTQEWVDLLNFLGGASAAGEKLKSKKGWNGETGVNNNSSGFTAVPAGLRDQNGNYNYLRDYTYFWSTPAIDADLAYVFNIDKGVSEIYSYNEVKKYGKSCRCVKD